MAARKQTQDFAKQLVKLSLDGDGQPDAERVAAVLETLRQDPPRRSKALLKSYAYYLDIEVRRGQARVEYAGPLAEKVLAEVEAHFTKAYGRKVVATAQENPALIAGLRVTVGDDVYDDSIAARLTQLEKQSALC